MGSCPSKNNKYVGFYSTLPQSHSKFNFKLATSHFTPDLDNFLNREYLLELLENICEISMDIVVDMYERMDVWIYYFWIYRCLKSGNLVASFN